MIDLDDGVKINYGKFGAALNPIKGTLICHCEERRLHRVPHRPNALSGVR